MLFYLLLQIRVLLNQILWKHCQHALRLKNTVLHPLDIGEPQEQKHQNQKDYEANKVINLHSITLVYVANYR